MKELLFHGRGGGGELQTAKQDAYTSSEILLFILKKSLLLLLLCTLYYFILDCLSIFVKNCILFFQLIYFFIRGYYRFWLRCTVCIVCWCSDEIIEDLTHSSCNATYCTFLLLLMSDDILDLSQESFKHVLLAISLMSMQANVDC